MSILWISLELIAPVCFNKSNRSTTSQCSTILSFHPIEISRSDSYRLISEWSSIKFSFMCSTKLRNTRQNYFQQEYVLCLHADLENLKIGESILLDNFTVFPESLDRRVNDICQITVKSCWLKTSSINDLIITLFSSKY